VTAGSWEWLKALSMARIRPVTGVEVARVEADIRQAIGARVTIDLRHGTPR
jgi:hypothetical protein